MALTSIIFHHLHSKKNKASICNTHSLQMTKIIFKTHTKNKKAYLLLFISLYLIIYSHYIPSFTTYRANLSIIPLIYGFGNFIFTILDVL